MRHALVTSCLVALAACSGKSASEKRIEEKARAAEKANAEREKAAADKQAAREAAMGGKPAPGGEVVNVAAPYGDSGNTIIRADGDCPDGLWSLFPGDAPGADPAEKKANAAKRPELSKALKEKTWLVKFKTADVKLSPYDAPRAKFVVDMPGSIDCSDSIGHITIAWTAAKATTPPPSAAQQGSEVTQNIWLAPPVQFDLAMPTMAQAKEFNDKNRLGLSARVVFKLGKVEVDKKLKKMPKMGTEAAGEKIVMGGGMEDWGAGRLVRAEVIGIRLAAEKEKTQLAEKKGDSK